MGKLGSASIIENLTLSQSLTLSPYSLWTTCSPKSYHYLVFTYVTTKRYALAQTRVHAHLAIFHQIFTRSTPTKLHMPRDVIGSEFSGGYTGHLLLVLFIRNVPFGLQRRVRFRVMPLLEGLYPLPCYRCHYSGCVKLREVVCCIVLCTAHHLWPEPSFCEFTRGPVLIVDTSTESPSSIFLGRSRTNACFPSGFVPRPCFFRYCPPPQIAYPSTCAR